MADLVTYTSKEPAALRMATLVKSVQNIIEHGDRTEFAVKSREAAWMIEVGGLRLRAVTVFAMIEDAILNEGYPSLMEKVSASEARALVDADLVNHVKTHLFSRQVHTFNAEAAAIVASDRC